MLDQTDNWFDCKFYCEFLIDEKRQIIKIEIKVMRIHLPSFYYNAIMDNNINNKVQQTLFINWPFPVRLSLLLLDLEKLSPWSSSGFHSWTRIICLKDIENHLQREDKKLCNDYNDDKQGKRRKEQWNSDNKNLANQLSPFSSRVLKQLTKTFPVLHFQE